MATLVAVLDEGSLTAAGRRLGKPLPTVSRRIADLERHLGTQLLARSTRRLIPTDAGASYAAVCRRILDEVRDAERIAAGERVEPRGTLAIAAPIVFGRLHVLPLVAAFLAAFPEIDVRLALADRNVDLLDDGIDVAVRIGHLRDSATIATRVGAVHRVVCASPAFLATHGTPVAPADLAALPCVTFGGVDAASAWSFAAGRRNRRSDPAIRSRLWVNTAEAARDAALADIGLTRLLSYQVLDDVEAGRLVLVLRPYEPAPVPVHLIHRGAELAPLKLRRFLDFATPHLRRRLAVVHGGGTDRSRP